MKSLICGLGVATLYALLLSTALPGALGSPKEDCVPRNTSYKVADTQQCDKYHECTKGGKMLERLCEDGFVFSEEITACDYPHNVNCSSRPNLQPTRSTNPDCARLNGLYAFPASESCQKFHHCLEGKAYVKTCPEGVIFDPSKGTCVHPDLSKARPDCHAKHVLNYTCPNYGKKFFKLRFGDHDRLPHPKNCRKFFICLSDGKPRVGGCPLGKVFNPKLGVCDSPKKVPECKDYYGKKDLAKLEKLAEHGEEGALEDDELLNVEDDEDTDDTSGLEGNTLQQTQDQATTQEEEEAQVAPSRSKGISKGLKINKFQPQTISKRQESSPVQGPAPAPSSSSGNPTTAEDEASNTTSDKSNSAQQGKASQQQKQSKKQDSDDDDDEEDDD